jgi:hypothetical protein
MSNTLSESDRLRAILSFSRADKADGTQDQNATVNHSLNNFKISFGKDVLNQSEWIKVENDLKKVKNQGISSDEFKIVYASTLDAIHTKKAHIKTLFDAGDTNPADGGKDDVLRNPQVTYDALIASPKLKALTQEQKEDIFNLIMVVHFNHDGVSKAEFENIFYAAQNAVDNKNALLASDIYMKTFFTALDEEDGKDGKFLIGNTLWGKLRSYSSLQGELTMDEWFKVYGDIESKKTDGITYEEFKGIFTKGLGYAKD